MGTMKGIGILRFAQDDGKGGRRQTKSSLLKLPSHLLYSDPVGTPAMTIEIHQPELEAMIQQRMVSGAFQSVEDVLMQAMKSLPATDVRPSKQNLADFLLSSPLANSDLVIERANDYPLPPSL